MCQTSRGRSASWWGSKAVIVTLSLSRACFSASLASLWLRRSSRLCCCSLKPFCFCRASVIHRGPASFSWTRELSSECLLCSEGFSAGRRVHLDSQDIFLFGCECSLAQNYKVKENTRDQEHRTTCGLKKEEARNSALNNKLSSFVASDWTF